MNADNDMIPGDYPSLLAEIKERVRSAQYEALRAVNRELVALYWDLGRTICERQAHGTGWGKAVVERLAADLRAEFPGVQGFSAQNLWYMRQFYLAYHGHEKLQPMVGEISWAKHLVILGLWYLWYLRNGAMHNFCHWNARDGMPLPFSAGGSGVVGKSTGKF